MVVVMLDMIFFLFFLEIYELKAKKVYYFHTLFKGSFRGDMRKVFE